MQKNEIVKGESEKEISKNPNINANNRNSDNNDIKDGQEGSNKDDDYLIITPAKSIFYQSKWYLEFLYWFLVFTSGGIFNLLCRWYPALEAQIRYTEVKEYNPEAEYALVTSFEGDEELVPIYVMDVVVPDDLINISPAPSSVNKASLGYKVEWILSSSSKISLLSRLFSRTINKDGPHPSSSLSPSLSNSDSSTTSARSTHLLTPRSPIASNVMDLDSPRNFRMFIWRYEKFWFDESSCSWKRYTFQAKQTYRCLHHIATQRILETNLELQNRYIFSPLSRLQSPMLQTPLPPSCFQARENKLIKEVTAFIESRVKQIKSHLVFPEKKRVDAEKESTERSGESFMSQGSGETNYSSDHSNNTNKDSIIIIEKEKGLDAVDDKLKGILQESIRYAIFGQNQTDIKVAPLYLIIINEALKPFFIFQIFSIAVWLLQGYVIYAYSIIFMTLYALTMNGVSEWTNKLALQSLAKSEGDINRPKIQKQHFNNENSERNTSNGIHDSKNVFVLGKAMTNVYDLVPGDLIIVEPKVTLPVDCIILHGSVIVNEAMLTGESAPVAKQAIPYPTAATNITQSPLIDDEDVLSRKKQKSPPNRKKRNPLEEDVKIVESEENPVFDEKNERDKKFILYCGTEVLQCRSSSFLKINRAKITKDKGNNPHATESCDAKVFWDPILDQEETAAALDTTGSKVSTNSSSGNNIVVAMVLNTSFSTERGKLVRSILYPKPPKFDFEKQGYRFIFVLLTALIVGIILQVSVYVHLRTSFSKTIMDCLNLVTIAVPPALPLSLSIGLQVSFLRLKQKRIFCSSTRSVAAAGRVNCLCFDKTGTLTEDGLILDSTHPLIPTKQENLTKKSALMSIENQNEERLTGKVKNGNSPCIGFTETTYSNYIEAKQFHARIIEYVMAACQSISYLEEDEENTEREESDSSILESEFRGEFYFDSDTGRKPGKNITSNNITSHQRSNSNKHKNVKKQYKKNLKDDMEEDDALDLLGDNSTSSMVNESFVKIELDSRNRTQEQIDQRLQERSKISNVTQAKSSLLPKKSNYENLIGDSLEIELFTSSGWELVSKQQSNSFFSQIKSDVERKQETFNEQTIWAHPILHLQSSYNSSTSTSILKEMGEEQAPNMKLIDFVETIIFPPNIEEDKYKDSSFPSASIGIALAILKKYEFDPSLRRMGVITLVLPLTVNDSTPVEAPTYLFLSKGSPEGIKQICIPWSIPYDYEKQVNFVTSEGFRVLACSYKILNNIVDSKSIQEIISLPRAKVESEMTMTGLISMKNPLKRETLSFLERYSAAAFRLIMITGDNALTAASVASMTNAFRDNETTFVKDEKGFSQYSVNSENVQSDDSRTMILLIEVNRVGSPSIIVRNALDSSKYITLLEFLSKFIDEEKLWLDLNTLQHIHYNIDYPQQYHNRKSLNLKEAITFKTTTEGLDIDENKEISLVCTGEAFALLLELHTALRGKVGQLGSSNKSNDFLKWTALEYIIARCNIYARMAPSDKEELVRSLQDIELIVCMTGDGANDSGALKAADIGISISAKEEITNEVNSKMKESIPKSDATPSIAAPFSTKIHHIGVIETIIAEGRCALVTSITMFKYMFIYGIIQFTGVLLLYLNLLDLSDWQYLWADLGVVLGFTLLIPMMRPRSILQKGKPEINLLSYTVLRSIIGQSIIVVCFQFLQQYFMIHSDWYEDYEMKYENNYSKGRSVNSTCKFIFSNFQYLIVAFAFCQTYGLFRNPIYKCLPLFLFFMIQIGLDLSFSFTSSSAKSKALQVPFDMVDIPYAFQQQLVLLAILNFFVALLYERYFVPQTSDDECPTSFAEKFQLQNIGVDNHDDAKCFLDKQPTILPKLRSRPPWYFCLHEAWRARDEGRGLK